jgi:hypothetical protein
MTNQPMKLLAVRLPEAERRRIKSLAASQGLTLQEAVHQAMEAWASQLQAEGAFTLAPLPGFPTGTDLPKTKRRRRVGKSSPDKQR